MPYWIDTHAHVYLKEFKPDLEAMLSRAKEAGVNRIYMPNIDHTSIDDMMELETKSEGGCVSM
ncbi:MAG: TatD family hydrolase, partial [Flammeovirgaceae bacterium]